MAIYDELDEELRKLAKVEAMAAAIDGVDAAPCGASNEKCGAAAMDPQETTPPELLSDEELALTLQQRQAIDLISTGQSIVATAETLGVHRATVFRWRKEPAFAAALKRQQDDLYAAAVDQMRGSLVKAIRTVSEELDRRNADDRLRAAYRLLPYVGSPKLRPAVEKEEAATPATGG